MSIEKAKDFLEKTLSHRALRNLNDIYYLSNELTDTPDFLGKPECPPEEPKESKTFHLKTLKNSHLQEFRELIEEQKTKKCGYESFKLTGKLCGGEVKDGINFECPEPVKPVIPENPANPFAQFKIDGDSKVKDSVSICLDSDSGEAQAEILKNTQTNLGRALVSSMNLEVLDKVAIDTTKLSWELNKFASIKEDKFASLEESLKAAEKVLKEERHQQLEKFLTELIGFVPCDYYTMPPEERDAYNKANQKLTFALRLFQKVGVADNGEVIAKAKEAVIDAQILFPRFKEHPRMVHLTSKILEI